MPTFVSWNVNSVKSRLLILLDFLQKYSPDVVMLQELKCVDEAFPKMEIEELGYNIATFGQKTYNGVAILSKGSIEDVYTDLQVDSLNPQSRYIEALTTIDGKCYRVASVYVPNGQEVGSEKYIYKLKFFQLLQERVAYLLTLDEQLLIGGDYNVAPKDIDVHDPKAWEGSILVSQDERKCFRSLLNSGLKDSYRIMHPDKIEYSWWDYRNRGWEKNDGLRIDQILVSPQASDGLFESGVYHEIRGLEKTSDHAPIYCKLK